MHNKALLKDRSYLVSNTRVSQVTTLLGENSRVILNSPLQISPLFPLCFPRHCWIRASLYQCETQKHSPSEFMGFKSFWSQWEVEASTFRSIIWFCFSLQGFFDFHQECFKKYGRMWGWVLGKLPVDLLAVMMRVPWCGGQSQPRASQDEAPVVKVLEACPTRDPRCRQVSRSAFWIELESCRLSLLSRLQWPRDSWHHLLSSFIMPLFSIFPPLGLLPLGKMHYFRLFQYRLINAYYNSFPHDWLLIKSQSPSF